MKNLKKYNFNEDEIRNIMISKLDMLRHPKVMHKFLTTGELPPIENIAINARKGDWKNNKN